MGCPVPGKGVAALTFRTVLQWMAIAVFCTLGAVVLALYRYKPQKELGYFLLYLTVLTLWALVIILAPVGSSGWSVFSAGDSLPSRFWQVSCCVPP